MEDLTWFIPLPTCPVNFLSLCTVIIMWSLFLMHSRAVEVLVPMLGIEIWSSWGFFPPSLHHVDQCNSPITIHRMFPTGGKDKKKKENARMGQGSPAHHSRRMSHDNQWHFYASLSDSLLSLSGWWTPMWETVWPCCGGEEIPVVSFKYPLIPWLNLALYATGRLNWREILRQSLHYYYYT